MGAAGVAERSVEMETFSSDDIERLITCRKRITQPPRREMKLIGGSYRNDLLLESEEGSERFSVFMRKNEQFIDNFSIGLKYFTRDGQQFNLLRCNGPHGEHIDLNRDDHMHYHYHIHRASAERINEGCFYERDAATTTSYCSYDEALAYFIKAVGIVDPDKHFPPHIFQRLLFCAEDE